MLFEVFRRLCRLSRRRPVKRCPACPRRRNPRSRNAGGQRAVREADGVKEADSQSKESTIK